MHYLGAALTLCWATNSIGWFYEKARTQNILTFMSQTGECRQQKAPSVHRPRRRNVTTSMVGLKMVRNANISPKIVSSTDVAGNEEEEGEKKEEEERIKKKEEEEEKKKIGGVQFPFGTGF